MYVCICTFKYTQNTFKSTACSWCPVYTQITLGLHLCKYPILSYLVTVRLIWKLHFFAKRSANGRTVLSFLFYQAWHFQYCRYFILWILCTSSILNLLPFMSMNSYCCHFSSLTLHLLHCSLNYFLTFFWFIIFR